MYKITDEISKEVLSVSEALPLGIITNAYVGERLSRVKGWLVSKDDSDEDGLLEMRRVLGRGDAVTVMNAGAVKPPRGMRCPLGARVYDSVGKYLGIFRDVLFDEGGRSTALVVDETEYAPSRVIAASAQAVILRAETHALLHPRRKPRPAGKHRPTTATIGSKRQEETDAPEAQSALPSEKTALSIYGDYAFLLGRRVVKDIAAKDAVVATAGSVVDARTIESARSLGKLVELTVNSRNA